MMALPLLKDNTDLQLEIVKLQNQLASQNLGTRTVEVNSGQQGESSLHLDILRHKSKVLKAQIDLTEGSTYKLLPNDRELQYEFIKERLSKQISQTKECLKFQEYQKKEMLESIKRERETNDELSSIVSASLAKQREKQMDKTSKKQLCDRLQAKCQHLDKINNQLQREISEFISQNFPLPDKRQFNTAKKQMQHDGVTLLDHGSLLSLTEIVEMLMIANADDPNDPYILTDHRFWPPYIEMLLECDIVIRHPADTKRLKLLPFHL